MSTSRNETNARKHTSTVSMAVSFIAINCLILSALTFMLTAIAIVTNNYDKWFPVAVVLSVALFFIGKLLLSIKIRKRIDAFWLNRK